jgi:hypothetical protein
MLMGRSVRRRGDRCVSGTRRGVDRQHDRKAQAHQQASRHREITQMWPVVAPMHRTMMPQKRRSC